MPREVSFGEAFREAGGQRRREAVPYPLTHEHIRRMCEQSERILRIQFDDERLPAEDEAILADLPLDDPDHAFTRYRVLCGLWHAHERGLRRRSDDERLNRWLIEYREPVMVRVAGRRVPVTSRSRAALIWLARYDDARIMLGQQLDMIEERLERLAQRRARAELGWFAYRRARGRLNMLAARVETELAHQMRGVLANALSPSGRAALPEEAPEWWAEVTDEDLERIAAALVVVGPRRLSAAQAPKRQPAAEGEANITFGDVLRMYEAKLRLPPLALEDEDLTRTILAIEQGSRGAAEADAEDWIE